MGNSVSVQEKVVCISCNHQLAGTAHRRAWAPYFLWLIMVVRAQVYVAAKSDDIIALQVEHPSN